MTEEERVREELQSILDRVILGFRFGNEGMAEKLDYIDQILSIEVTEGVSIKDLIEKGVKEK